MATEFVVASPPTPMPINRDFRSTVARLVKAKTPLIAVITHEELALQRLLRGATRDREVFVWSCTRGLVRIEADGKETIADATMVKPELLFKHILASPAHAGAFYIMRDLHPWMSNVPTVRGLRDVAEYVSDKQITVFLSSPIFPIPPELEKTIQLISMPLPNAEILQHILEQTALVAAKGGIHVDITPQGGRAIVSALAGLTELEAEQALAEAMIVHKQLSQIVCPTLLKTKAQAIKRAGFEYREPIDMVEVGGVPNVKEYAVTMNASLTPEAAAFGVRKQRAVLLAGPPGSGKTLICSALTLGSRPVLRGSFAAMYTSELGGTEANVLRFLKLAEATDALVQVDEIEKSFGGDGNERNGGTSGRVLEVILTWLEDSPGNVVACFTANHPEKLPPEFLSRMSAIFWMGLPTLAGRREIWAIQLRQVKRNPADYDIELLAQQSHDYVGREIRNALDAALARLFVQGAGRDVPSEVLLAQLLKMPPASKRNQAEIKALEEWGRAFAISADEEEAVESVGRMAAVASGMDEDNL